MASNLPPLPDEIWADPGRRDWYFRERKPDSVARYVRDTRIAALEADLAKEKAENARLWKALGQIRNCTAEHGGAAKALKIIAALR